MSFLLLTPHPLESLGLGRYAATLSAGRGQHVLIFSGLAFFGAASRWPISRWVLAFLLAGYGMATEGLQAFIPPRTADWGDVAEDLVGVVVGLALYAVFARLTARRRTAA